MLKLRRKQRNGFVAFGDDIDFKPRILFAAELTIYKLSEIRIKPFSNKQDPCPNDHLCMLSQQTVKRFVILKQGGTPSGRKPRSRQQERDTGFCELLGEGSPR